MNNHKNSNKQYQTEQKLKESAKFGKKDNEERILNQGEISSLTNDKKKLDNELKICEKELQKRGEEIKRHIENIHLLRKENEKKEMEKESIKKKLKEIESNLQEKSKLAGFSSKLKNGMGKSIIILHL